MFQMSIKSTKYFDISLTFLRKTGSVLRAQILTILPFSGGFHFSAWEDSITTYCYTDFTILQLRTISQPYGYSIIIVGGAKIQFHSGFPFFQRIFQDLDVVTGILSSLSSFCDLSQFLGFGRHFWDFVIGFWDFVVWVLSSEILSPGILSVWDFVI